MKRFTYNQNGDVIKTEDIPDEVPFAVSRAKAKIALVRAGLYGVVNGFVETSNNDELKIWWGEAQEFERKNPLVVSVGAALGLTEAQLDALFIEAGR